MNSAFSFPSTAPAFGTGAAPFNFSGSSTGTTGVSGNIFGAQQTSSGIGLGNPTSTSGGLTTLGSAGTLFSTASFPTTTTPAINFSGFGAPTNTTKPSFGLGLGTTAPAVPQSTGFGFTGSTVPPATTSAFGFNVGQNLFASTTAFGTLGTNLALSQPVVSAAVIPSTASLGLGGVDIVQTTAGDLGSANIAGKIDSKAVKEIAVPMEILSTVEVVKKYVKEQKNIKEEITRISPKPLHKVQEETDALKNLLSVVSNGIQRNVAVVEKLKLETAQELKNAEIAHRTKDTSPGLQYENVGPTEYFQNMVVIFENRMQLYRQKIEQMERHLMGLSQSAALTPQELTLAMKRIHETFIALAAQLQNIHEAVKAQKEQYLNYRKIFHGDTTDTFETRSVPAVNDSSSRTRFNAGPTPFSNVSSATAVAMASALNRMQQPTAGPPPTLGFSSGSLGSGIYGSSNLGAGSTFNPSISGLSNSNLSFGSPNTLAIKPLGALTTNTNLGLSYGSTTSHAFAAGYGSAPATPLGHKQPFQLQKPPQGSKRGKRVAYN